MEAARQVRGQTAVRLRQRPTPRASAKMTRGDAASAGEYTNLKWSGAQATLAEAVRIRGTGKLKVNYKLRLRPTPDFRLVHACGANERSGSRDRRVTDLLFGVHLFASVRPLNACPPEGPEALQACSLFQGTKAWLEPRLEPAELIPALPWTRSAVLVFEQALFVRLVRLFS